MRDLVSRAGQIVSLALKIPNRRPSAEWRDAIDAGVWSMDSIRLQNEAYKRAIELNKKGEHEEAAKYARQAIQLAKEMSATAGIPYSGSTAESLLELIENDLKAAVMAREGNVTQLLRDLGTLQWPQAIEALEKIGAPAVGPLIELVTDSTADVKRRGLATSALGGIGDPAAVDAILQLLREDALDTDKYAKRNVILALKEFNDPRIPDGVGPSLQDSDTGVRDAAQWVREQYGSQAGVEPRGAEPTRVSRETPTLKDGPRSPADARPAGSARHGRKRWWQFWRA